MEPIFPVLPGKFQELIPVLCSKERARTERVFLIWVSFLSQLSLGLKFLLSHVKGSGQDLTMSIRHLVRYRQTNICGKGKEQRKSLINS